MKSIVLPTHETFQEWFMDLNRSFPGLIVPTPLPDMTWWHSAMQLISFNGKLLSHVVLPQKSSFPKENDWKRWAMMFIQSINDN